MKSVIEKAESMKGKTDPRYTLKTDEMEELYRDSGDWFYVIVNSFHFGYLQGMRAAKAEMNKSVK